MSINELYHNWYGRIFQLRTTKHKVHVANFTWLMIGLLESKSVHLSKVALAIRWCGTTKWSRVRRLTRLLANPHIRVREWYASVAQEWVGCQVAHLGAVRLIVDGTKIGFGHQLLMVALATRRRAVPIAWTWVRAKRGHSSGYKQLALLSYVKSLLPDGVPVSLVGDAEFGVVPLMQHLEAWGWQYAFRQKGSHLIQLAGQSHWQSCAELLTHPGQTRWLPQTRLTAKHAYTTNLCAHWQCAEKAPWLLATNFPTRRETLAHYRRRMWIEEMFGDFKRNGFDLERTHLRHFLALSRLTLAIALLYTWLFATGTYVVKAGLRYLVDRTDRRDLSLFRIGLDFILYAFSVSLRFSFRLKPFL
jgi:hypothetical protein